MGLAITAYSYIKTIGYSDEYDEDYEWHGVDDKYIHQERINPYFPHAVPRDTPPGYLQFLETGNTESYSFSAGSYGGYNMFREHLINIFFETEVSGEMFWDNIEEYKDKPLYELINFSDCEGIIYGPVCAKIHNDLINGTEQFTESLPTGDGWTYESYVKRYDHWTKAFALARNSGLVIFH